MSGPRDLSPREARERFLARRKRNSTERTVRSYSNRLNVFVHWCESENIESMSELTGWHLDEFLAFRSAQDVAPATIKGSMTAVRQLLKYCVRIEVVDEDLLDKVEVPKLTKDQQTSDDKLETDEAKSLLEFYRSSTQYYGTAWHALLEVAWHTGARMGGLRSLDLSDFDASEQTFQFVHRPDSGTPLKNKTDGERIVGVPKTVVDVLNTYIARERSDKRDDSGREPLFAARQGRPSDTTFRCWSYLATQPCLYRACPHGRDRHSCSYTNRNKSSQCPSSRSPHAIRTGSITWQLDRGIPIELVAERVNAAPATIRRYYDKADELERFRERRQEIALELDIEEGA
ncbi:phage integrase/site-specific recombinase [Haloferax mediterranei ATCC 33500]|uniref:Integrase n=1 Tax=Haloferax mediterranei (strain ATCC 33500 / DSM 1411 / JCM 8866 / NBRC 14739 / NCIMB 2177 / R-4) TaxID=523841 RepID=I3R486_HALMT|nr:phage integrase/site-specific recombinase [Haloferax mediterranei ATCC 33500]AHZ21595.1 integrase [Haloferax mediterranei ATCC 33500]